MKNITCHNVAQGASLAKILGASMSANQGAYLGSYLARLSLMTVVEERHYFDRDYLAEYSAFYSTSAREYTNRCRRLHFFSCSVTDDLLEKLASGDRDTADMMDRSFLGFAVIRPIAAKFGRTVVGWYPDNDALKRNVAPSRAYYANLLGHRFKVEGLAWQQQDAAVGACATIALWSMLHSSAFDDYHAIPTTADITRYAHRTAALGSRVFPSSGLTHVHVLEAIKEAGLAPVFATPDMKNSAGQDAMSSEKFTSTCAALIRSRYPALVAGRLQFPGGIGHHAVCVTGFRETGAPVVSPNDPVQFHDKGISFLYVHDDNIGPNVRFQVRDSADGVMLEPSSPNGASVTPGGYGPFWPTSIIAALHEGIRVSPTDLLVKGLEIARQLQAMFNQAVGIAPALGPAVGFSVSAKFCKTADYLGEELKSVCASSTALARVRLAFVDEVGPVCLHMGVIRIGTAQAVVMDIICDTTDSTLMPSELCYVVFDQAMHQVLSAVGQGVLLAAF